MSPQDPAQVRFTDFLVNEISLSGEIVHLVDIGAPTEGATEPPKAGPSSAQKAEAPEITKDTAVEDTATEVHVELPAELTFDPRPDWTTSTTVALRSHFSDETIVSLHALLLDGKEVRMPVDAGWGGPRLKMTEEEEAMNVVQGQGRDRGRGRQGGRGQTQSWGPADKREVASQVRDPRSLR